jgi:hypothetical protein
LIQSRSSSHLASVGPGHDIMIKLRPDLSFPPLSFSGVPSMEINCVPRECRKIRVVHRKKMTKCTQKKNGNLDTKKRQSGHKQIQNFKKVKNGHSLILAIFDLSASHAIRSGDTACKPDSISIILNFKVAGNWQEPRGGAARRRPQK